ncbi:MAG: peptide chain release factor N(5)-glutamine methyltransferase [Chloracidobacterium sp.]
MSVTLGELVKEGAQRLAAGQVPDPYRTAVHLVRETLEVDAAKLIAHPEHQVDEDVVALVRQAFARRAGGEPLQYITGRQSFYGRTFQVTSDVLIPRPETELLVEAVLDYTRGQVRTDWRVLDVGTGSGCLAVTLAAELPGAQVWAVDISPAALAVATANAQCQGVAERVAFVESDWLSALPTDTPPFDIIVSNPPYIAEHEFTGLQREVRDHEPYVALIAGPSGTEAYERLLSELPPWLAPGGILACEVGFGQATQVGALAEIHGWQVQRVMNDLQGIPRALLFTPLPMWWTINERVNYPLGSSSDTY